jgi:hypothetical protein
MEFPFVKASALRNVFSCLPAPSWLPSAGRNSHKMVEALVGPEPVNHGRFIVIYIGQYVITPSGAIDLWQCDHIMHQCFDQ